MKIKLIITLAILILVSCSFRQKIENINIVYEDQYIFVKMKITHEQKINNSYFYYGEITTNLSKKLEDSSKIPYIIATYKNQKSKFYYDSIADYPDFFGNLEWNEEVKKNKVYIAFDSKIDAKKIVLKATDKKFKNIPLDFYDY